MGPSTRTAGGERQAKDVIHCLVFDLGAGSGRTMIARYAAGSLTLTEIDRFDDLAITSVDGARWNVEGLKRHIENGLHVANRLVGEVDAIGIDSWGLDYTLLNSDGLPVTTPYHYRNPRSLRGFSTFPLAREWLYSVTGSQILPVNTVFQLHDEIQHHPSHFLSGHSLLMMSDLVNHHLTGERKSELTLARTSGLLDSGGQNWSSDILAKIGIPAELFQPLIQPGDIYGGLRPELAGQLGWGRVPVVAVAAHDTASAVAGLPLDENDAFVICGSWSLVGAETETVDTQRLLFDEGFGNEGGVEGKPFLVRSLNGLHLINGLRRSWRRRTGEDVTFAMIGRKAAGLDRSSVPAIDASDPSFFNPDDVIEAINEFHYWGGFAPLDDIGALALSIYKGLARDIAQSLEFLEARRGRTFSRVRMCGGGAQDAAFCELLAKSFDRPLVVGPVEASAWGNAVMQLIGIGRVDSLERGRRIIAESAEFRIYGPAEPAAQEGNDD